MGFNTTCNATLDDMRITTETPIVGSMTFHTLGLIIAGACASIAILLSLYLMWMHAIHYTKPYEQRHIIRILFMVPIYATASFLSFWYYWHAIYFQVLSDCYEAFAIASFFALLCHYCAPNLHEQKNYFRNIDPIKPWVLPVNWFRSCCGGETGPWRTPKSGLTWFNIIWIGIYHYCFIRVAMTVLAVITQYFGKYCESSNSPVFAHIWVLVIEGTAVTIAMYCVIQFYIQLRVDLAPHSPFLKVLAIKLVIFLSFWQSFAISILTSATFNVVQPTAAIAYPDLKIGIPSLLLCIEMACFAVLHLFAFPWKPYSTGSQNSDYPVSPGMKNEIGPKNGGPLGIKAFADALNPWDLVKSFARGMRWLFVGVKHRKNDPSYKDGSIDFSNDLSMEPQTSAPQGYKRTEPLPIAEEFRRSKFGLQAFGTPNKVDEEGAGLIAHAQPNPLNHTGSGRNGFSPNLSGYVPARQRYDSNGQDISVGGNSYSDNVYGAESNPDRIIAVNPLPGAVQQQQGMQGSTSGEIGMAISDPTGSYQSHIITPPYPPNHASDRYLEEKRKARQQQGAAKPSEQWANSSQPSTSTAAPHMHNALWGSQAPSKDQSHHLNES